MKDIDDIALEVAQELYAEHDSDEPLTLANAGFDFAHRLLEKLAELNPPVAWMKQDNPGGHDQIVMTEPYAYGAFPAFTYPPAPQKEQP